MAIVTVKNKFQVVIPQALREKLGISRGDVLEARAERGRLTYTPKAVIDRIPAAKAERELFFKKLSDRNILYSGTSPAARSIRRQTARSIEIQRSAEVRFVEHLQESFE